jgi:hypothetical protein
MPGCSYSSSVAAWHAFTKEYQSSGMFTIRHWPRKQSNASSVTASTIFLMYGYDGIRVGTINEFRTKAVHVEAQLTHPMHMRLW